MAIRKISAFALVAVACLMVSHGATVVRSQDSSADEASDWTEKTVGDLILDLPNGWQSDGDTATDEGRWISGDPDAPDASIEVFRDRTLEQLDVTLNVEHRSDAQLAGRPAELLSGTVGTVIVSRRGLVAVQKQPGPGGALVAVVCLATLDNWETYEPIFRNAIISLRPPGTKRPIVAVTPGAASPGNAPPDAIAPSGPTAERWYVHGRGDYALRLGDGWTVREGVTRNEPDADFDTIVDPTGTRMLVCARVYEDVRRPEDALTRWRQERSRSLQSGAPQARNIRVGEAIGVQIAYREPATGATGFRLSFVARGRRYAVSAYLPAGTPRDALPSDVTQMLDSVRFFHDPRAADGWAKATVENITLPIPPGWTLQSGAGADGVLAAWAARYRDREATFTVAKTPDINGAVARLKPIWRTFGLLAGDQPATAYYGRSGDGKDDIMVVMLDYPADGRWTIFICQAASSDWARNETAFEQMIAGARIDGATQRQPKTKPSPTGQLGHYPQLDYLAGDFSYELTSYNTGVVVRRLDSGRVETVWSQRASYPVAPIFQKILDQNASLARDLGAAVTERVPLFDDALRIQVFDGGVMISETASRHHWWCTHALRSEQ